MAAFTPIPRASVNTTVAENAGVRTSERNAILISPSNPATYRSGGVIVVALPSDTGVVPVVILPPPALPRRSADGLSAIAPPVRLTDARLELHPNTHCRAKQNHERPTAGSRHGCALNSANGDTLCRWNMFRSTPFTTAVGRNESAVR